MENTNRKLNFTHDEIETLTSALITAIKSYDKARSAIYEFTEDERDAAHLLTAKMDAIRLLFNQITNSEKDV